MNHCDFWSINIELCLATACPCRTWIGHSKNVSPAKEPFCKRTILVLATVKKTTFSFCFSPSEDHRITTLTVSFVSSLCDLRSKMFPFANNYDINFKCREIQVTSDEFLDFGWGLDMEYKMLGCRCQFISTKKYQLFFLSESILFALENWL